ncbi:hypothetical protein LINGRAHAP2_LOCUS4567, partial [Linum grandiflorum]
MELQDDGDRPIGDLLSFFGSYTGECSRNYGYYPISADSWDKMPMAFKDRAWDALALRIFHIEPQDMKNARDFWDKKVGRAWARSRLALWDKRKKEAAALGKEPGW